jgi:hypothetical protein
MRFIITENKFDDIVDKYLTNTLGDEFNSHSHPNPATDYIWYTDKYGIPVFERDSDGFGVREDIWENLRDFFGFSPLIVDRYLIKWLRENLYLDIDPSEFYTFEKGD